MEHVLVRKRLIQGRGWVSWVYCKVFQGRSSGERKGSSESGRNKSFRSFKAPRRESEDVREFGYL